MTQQENMALTSDDRASHQTVKFLCTHAPDFIGSENWPPNSPCLNSVGYLMPETLQQLVYEKHVNI